MKHTLTILAGLLLEASAQAANYTAAAAGNWHTTNTWGVTSLPGASDHVDLNGKAVTQTGTVVCASLVDVATGGSLTFGAGASFTCRAVTNAPLATASTGVVVDCDYTLTAGSGFMINAGGEATISGTWRNSGGDSDVIGVENKGGTVTDFSGSIANSGGGIGVRNRTGTWSQLSGSIINSGSGWGALNDATWSDFSGSIANSGSGPGAMNNSGATWIQFSGSIVNSGTGTGAHNASGTWTDFSGESYDLGTGTAFDSDGTVGNITGIIGRPSSQPDLAAENIVTGKTILGVTGSRAAGYGINGTGLLGAGW